MKKKLIEVALPLEAINKAAAKEKSIRHGHPSTLHIWWSRKPLSACRAVIFASLVDDPSSRTDQFPTEEEQERERQRLFGIVERLVLWENVNNQAVLKEAKAEILKSTGGMPPAIYDPFCGGGSIPLEAQRLGLEAHASDLNPVAVLITKALIDIPAKFVNRTPINPNSRQERLKDLAYPGAIGLAEDVRYYGEWMGRKAKERIGHLYPTVRLSDGRVATAIAWIWARTVTCPNPACQAEMILTSKWEVSKKAGKVTWVEPEVNHAKKTIRFTIRSGKGTPPKAPKVGRGANFRCLMCGQVASDAHIKTEGKAGRMSVRLLGIVIDAGNGRAYVEPNPEHERIAASARVTWAPNEQLGHDPRAIWCVLYGLTRFRDLFTSRQLELLTALSDLAKEAIAQSIVDGADESYANAIGTYLGLLVSRLANNHSNIVLWSPTRDQSKNTFSRQAIPMAWDFAEVNPFGGAAGDIADTAIALGKTISSAGNPATVTQLDATQISPTSQNVVFSTDPPYYDNIGYADLSDFFYVWLRKSLSDIYPELFSTLLVPKAQEIVATPYRFAGSRDEAEAFFQERFGQAITRLRSLQISEYPLTIFYAFKQSESDDEAEEQETAIVSTGWETMLEGLLKSDFQITGTWPMRSERTGRMNSIGTNALASSIVLVCRPRPESASLTTRKDFLGALKRELGPAIRILQKENIPAVDLQQAAIGPGMAIFSRYKKVIESDGSAMRVRVALGLINQALDEVLSEQESDYDAETRWALAWFEQNQFNEGLFGDANTLANAKALSVEGMQSAGIVSSRAGKVRLLKRSELSERWDPSVDSRITVWEVTQQLIHVLDTKGQDAARDLAAKVGGMAETARELAYRLYTLCERKGWAEEAGYYNALVVAWPAIRAQEFALTGQA